MLQLRTAEEGIAESAGRSIRILCLYNVVLALPTAAPSACIRGCAVGAPLYSIALPPSRVYIK